MPALTADFLADPAGRRARRRGRGDDSTAWFRQRARSVCRFANSRTPRRDRPAAPPPAPGRATRRAPPSGRRSGSFLFDWPVPSTRTRDANVAGTSTTSRRRRRAAGPTDSPSRRPTPPPTSGARHRPPTPTARRPGGWPARTLIRSVRARRRSSIVAVCDALCGSIPIITSIMGPPSSVGNRGRHSCFEGPARPSFEPRPRRDPDRPTLRSTARHEIGRQFESDPAGASRRYENPRNAYHNSIRQFCARLSGCDGRPSVGPRQSFVSHGGARNVSVTLGTGSSRLSSRSGRQPGRYPGAPA